MKLTKTLASAAAVAVLSVNAASALTPAQCSSLGGTVVLASASCQLTSSQLAAAQAQGLVPGAGSAGAAGAAGLGGVVGLSTGAAAVAGLALVAVVAGDGSSGTTTTGSSD